MKLPRQRPFSFAPFYEELRSYSLSGLRSDLFAALVVAFMTIPQSIAYSMLAGLPPTAGLFSAIFGTLFTSGIGSSRHLISGPSTGIAILIQSSIADILSHSEGIPPSEAMVLSVLTQMVLLIGIIQITAAFLNVQKLLQFVSRPVVLGYFAGITVAIAVTQMFHLTGVQPPSGVMPIFSRAWFYLSHLATLEWKATLLGGGSLLLLWGLRKSLPNWPHGFLLLIIASFFAYGLNQIWGEGQVATLGTLDVPKAPIPTFDFPWIDLTGLNQVFPAAVAVAFLGILEVFSVGRAFAAKGGQTYSVNQDVLGLSIGNLFLSLIPGAMPASGSATRTSVNYRLGAKTRFAALFSSFVTAAALFFLWPGIRHIPLAALAALLIATVHTLMDWKEIQITFRATREDAWVFLLTFFSCLIFSLDIAFFIGIVISIGSFLRKSSMPHLVEYAFNTKGRLVGVSSKDDPHRKVRIIGIGGDLYFATADVFQAALQSVAEAPDVQAIVLRLNNVHRMDASMCLAILQLFETLRASHRHLIISGVTEEVWHVFQRAGVVQKIGLDNLYFTDESNPQFSTWKAALHAQDLVHRSQKE